MPAPVTLAPGLIHHPGFLDAEDQAELAGALREVVRRAPLFVPRMPRTGKPFSVRMTNCGPLGWTSDASGYRYQPTHPATGQPWPAIPRLALEAWRRLAGGAPDPEACLVNFYGPDARMGLHQDRDEGDFTIPVISLSLGDTAVFRFGGVRRTDPTSSIRLASGDAVVIGGPSRLAFHGIDRLIRDTSPLLGTAGPAGWRGGRVNLTLRRVTAAG
jgi:alkylated DNA repair protein (DNA oxidative demethylase)